jgi:hypothetical protein
MKVAGALLVPGARVPVVPGGPTLGSTASNHHFARNQ